LEVKVAEKRSFRRGVEGWRKGWREGEEEEEEEETAA